MELLKTGHFWDSPITVGYPEFRSYRETDTYWDIKWCPVQHWGVILPDLWVPTSSMYRSGICGVLYLQLEEFRALNGIQGIAKAEEEKSASQHESPAEQSQSNSLSDSSSLARQQNSLPSSGHGDNIHQSSITSDAPLSPSLSSSHGKAIFIHKPSLITELYPPGVEVQDRGLLGNILIQGSEEDLKNAVCSQMIPVAYITNRSCPIELTQWLFQVMACSAEPQVSYGALRSLTGLLQYALKQKSDFSVPSVTDITDVLVTLGAERKRLRLRISVSGTHVYAMPNDQEREQVFTSVPPPHNNLLNIISYITSCIRSISSYTVQQLEDLLLILSNLSLDHHCQHFLRRSLQACIHQILAAYPESVWHKAVKRLSPQLLSLSPHHKDKVCLARLINGSMPRARCLVRDFCRFCLKEMVGLHGKESLVERPNSKGAGNSTAEVSSDGKAPEKAISKSTEKCETKVSRDDKYVVHVDEPFSRGVSEASRQGEPASTKVGTSDCAFMKEVLQSYHRIVQGNTCMSDEDCYKMHSVLQLLQLYAPLSDISFPDEESKQGFIALLGALRASVREDPLRSVTSVVKDVLIRMKLELEARGNTRQEKQTDLFSFCS